MPRLTHGLIKLTGVLAAAATAALTAHATSIQIRWTYPTNYLGYVSFRIYWTTNVTIPTTNWIQIAESPSTNLVERISGNPVVTGTNHWFSFSTPISAATPNYYAVAPVNPFWGEGAFSPVLCVLPPHRASQMEGRRVDNPSLVVTNVIELNP